MSSSGEYLQQKISGNIIVSELDSLKSETKKQIRNIQRIHQRDNKCLFEKGDNASK